MSGGSGATGSSGADGGAGGTGSGGQAGGNGTPGNPYSGGGGGGAAGGGRGGVGALSPTPGTIGLGGKGGTATHPDGYAGVSTSNSSVNANGAGGGGGGFNGYTGSGTGAGLQGGTIRGGAGGPGGNACGSGSATAPGGGGGGGGAGGYGAIVSGADVMNYASVLGGAGGAGGYGGGADFVGKSLYGAAGGDGGVGLLATGTAATIVNTQAARLVGGAGGSGRQIGHSGAGGAGIATPAFSLGPVTLDNAGYVGGGGGGNARSSFGVYGGNGGAGVAFANVDSTVTNRSGATIAGGGGGYGFKAGGGGAGIAFTQSGGTVTNGGTIRGGDGGATTTKGTAGTAGAGIVGSDMTIVDTGAIAGGSGLAQADAITFLDGDNTLALGANAGQVGANGLKGAVDIAAGSLTFDQTSGTGLPTDATLAAQIVGGGRIIKSGSGTLTLSGANSFTSGTTISAGTLAVAADGNLGATATSLDPTAGSLTLAGGTLETTTGFTSARAVTLSATTGSIEVDSGTTTLSGTVGGSGALSKTGGGTLVLAGTDSYEAGTVIRAGTLELLGKGSVAAGVISFQGNGGAATLALGSGVLAKSGGTFGDTLDSFGSGDSLDLQTFNFVAGGTRAEYDAASHTLSVTDGKSITYTFNLTNETPGAGGTFYAHKETGGTGTVIDDVVVCYAAGTAIRTTTGDVAIEALRVGDGLVTASGAARPVRWLGHRRVDCRRHVQPQAAWPIRIAAQAIGADRPARDLYVSPGHAICVDVLGEVLIPAAALVNGTSVVQVEVDAVDYWHVELDAHDIILAENLAAESYIDCGNRGFFVEGGRRGGVARSAAAADSRAPDRAA